MSNEFNIKGYHEKFAEYKESSQKIIELLEDKLKNKDLSIECLKNIIKHKELKIASCDRKIASLNRDIDKLDSEPFWRFW